MGGDHGPQVIVPAAAAALKDAGDIRFMFFGDERKIKPELDKHPALQAVSQIIHTDKVIGSEDKASSALRNGKDSSMRLAIEAVKDGKADAIVSAGNTGAVDDEDAIMLRAGQRLHAGPLELPAVTPDELARTVLHEAHHIRYRLDHPDAVMTTFC